MVYLRLLYAPHYHGHHREHQHNATFTSLPTQSFLIVRFTLLFGNSISIATLIAVAALQEPPIVSDTASQAADAITTFFLSVQIIASLPMVAVVDIFPIPDMLLLTQPYKLILNQSLIPLKSSLSL
ncbi:hypothetical protein HN51_023310 [Arachis hypogaea]